MGSFPEQRLVIEPRVGTSPRNLSYGNEFDLHENEPVSEMSVMSRPKPNLLVRDGVPHPGIKLRVGDDRHFRL